MDEKKSARSATKKRSSGRTITINYQPATLPASVRRLKKTDSIFVAGHRGLAGGAIFRELQRAGYANLLTRTRAEVDLRQRECVRAFFAEQRPQVVVVAAAKSGGIKANYAVPV